MKRALACPMIALLACAHAGVAPPRTQAPQELAARVKAAHEQPQTLTAEAKAFVDAPENGGKYSLHISVKRPASLRIEALTPLGDPAAVLVAEGGRFALFDLRRNEFYRGPSTPKNLSRLFPVPLRDDELVALFLGGAPELTGSQPISAAAESDYFKLVYAASDLQQEVLAHQEDLRILKVTRGRAAGPPLFTITLEEHSGALPKVIKLAVPEQKIFLDLRVRNMLAGKPPPGGAFALEPPKGVQVIDLNE